MPVKGVWTTIGRHDKNQRMGKDALPPTIHISDDSDIEIPVYRPSESYCWSCQNVICVSDRPVILNSDVILPICSQCWSAMPIADRMRLGIEFLDRWKPEQ